MEKIILSLAFIGVLFAEDAPQWIDITVNKEHRLYLYAPPGPKAGMKEKKGYILLDTGDCACYKIFNKKDENTSQKESLDDAKEEAISSLLPGR